MTGRELSRPFAEYSSDWVRANVRPPQPIGERMTEELKACPHGKGARIINIGGLAPFSIYLGPDHTCHRDFGWFETREEAIAAWNSRPLTGGVTEAETIQVIAQVVWKEVGPAITAPRAADIAREIYLAMSNVSRGVK
jgi:hypothetical protein